MADHYTTLGVGPSATPGEIRSAYRRLVKSCHPDTNPGPGSEAKFREVQEAYGVLSDASRRGHYDETIRLREQLAAKKMEEAQARRDEQTASARAKADSASKAKFLERKAKTEALRRAVAGGRFGEAESLASSLLDERFGDALCHSIIADMARVRGQYGKAAKHYAYACQFDPSNAAYLRLHEDMSAAALRTPERRMELREPGASPFPLLTGLFVVVVGAVYSGLAVEGGLFPFVAAISTVTLAQLAMLALAGIAIGASMSAGNLLGPMDLGGSAVINKVHPAVALGFVACINFWAAIAVYALVGVSQRAFNPSLSRLFLGVALTVLAFSFARYGSGMEAVGQTFVWSGNLVYAGAALGWLVADGLRGLRPGA